jgi:transposase-like protein
MPARVDPKVKGAALADLATGMGVRAVARKYGVPQGTVSRWWAKLRAELRAALAAGSGAAPVPAGSTVRTGNETLKRDRPPLADLVYEYMLVSLEAQIAQARLFGDLDWLRGQAAASIEALAVLHGVLNDKVVRLLYALQPADNGDGDGDEDGAGGARAADPQIHRLHT